MSNINIKIDVSKIDKSKIIDREYTNKEGQKVIQKQYAMDVVALKEPKIVSEGVDWVMSKTHIVVEGQTKEEKQNKIKSKIIGDGFAFSKKEVKNDLDIFDEPIDYPSEDNNLEDIPF